MIKKIVSEGPDCQKRLLEGAEFIDRLVGNTIGPYGRNRVIGRKYKSPMVVNDGATIARHSYMDDEVADLGAQMIVDVSMKTAEQAGDATSGSVVIAVEHIRTCFGLIKKEETKSELEGGSRVNVIDLKNQTQEELAKALAILKKNSRQLKGKDLDDVISTSLENLEYGKTLGEMIRTIGPDGYISVEDNWATQYGISTEVITGMKFLASYASPYLATSFNQKDAVWENTHVLVTNHRIESAEDIKELVEEFKTNKVKKLVIIGGYSEGENPFSQNFIKSVAKGVQAFAGGNESAIQVLAVKASSLTTPELQDVAEFCDAVFVDKSLNHKIEDVRTEHLGFAKKVSVGETEANIIGGKGNTSERIKVLKQQVEESKDVMFKEKLKRRIASLSSGVGVIRVGAPTESEASYLKYKLEDAVAAAKCALEEGVVKGGGLALKEVADELGKDALIYNALMSPYKRIRKNAGKDITVGSHIVDAHKVIRIALQNALSGAGVFITTDGAITERRQTFMDQLERLIAKALPYDNRNDFRDSENQDLGAGRLVD